MAFLYSSLSTTLNIYVSVKYCTTILLTVHVSEPLLPTHPLFPYRQYYEAGECNADTFLRIRFVKYFLHFEKHLHQETSLKNRIPNLCQNVMSLLEFAQKINRLIITLQSFYILRNTNIHNIVNVDCILLSAICSTHSYFYS